MALSWIFLLYAFIYTWGNFLSIPGTIGDFFKQIPALAIYNSWPPLLGAGNKITALVFAGTSLSIMMILPKVVELIQGFMTGKPFAYGTAIGEAVGPVGAVWGATGGKVVGVAKEYAGAEVQYQAAKRAYEALGQRGGRVGTMLKGAYVGAAKRAGHELELPENMRPPR